MPDREARLKPCPFCHSRSIQCDNWTITGTDGWACYCVRCKASGPIRATEKGSRTAWNRRPRDGS